MFRNPLSAYGADDDARPARAGHLQKVPRGGADVEKAQVRPPPLPQLPPEHHRRETEGNFGTEQKQTPAKGQGLF